MPRTTIDGESITGPVSLPGLLSATLHDLEQAYIAEGAGRDGMPSVHLWDDLLRAVDEHGVDVRDLPTLLRLSKRAVRTRLATAARHEWVEFVGGVPKRVRLTDLGTEVAGRWPCLRRAAEARYSASVGVDRVRHLRAAVERIVCRLPLEHPHSPASYGPADASITGGPGVDWKPVVRAVGDSVSGLSLSALVSQLSVAFAVDYERLSPVALSLSIRVIRRIPSTGVPLKDLGPSVGISALLRHGFLRVDGERGREAVFLTSSGERVRTAFPERIAAVERDWETQFGADVIRELRCALEAAEMREARR